MSAKRVQMVAKPKRPPEHDVEQFVSSGVERPQPSQAQVTEAAGKMKRLTIDVDADLHRRLKVACAQSGHKMADFLRDLIGKHVP